MTTGDDDVWVCQCRKCLGVTCGAEAAQYVWEFGFGSCEVPFVSGVVAHHPDGFVFTNWSYWHGEPDEPFATTGHETFMVSCRPGEGTMPTEGDLARWALWQAQVHPPKDWVLLDGLNHRSVAAVAAALERRQPLPEEAQIVGDWDDTMGDRKFRARVRAEWDETVRRNRAQIVNQANG
jgi:hypothetical protein